MRNLKLSDYSEGKNSPEPQSEKITKLGLTMPKTKGKYDKLIEAILDLEEAIENNEIGIHPFCTGSKRPREIDGKSHKEYWQNQIELDKIKKLGAYTNIGFTMGYDPENKGHHLSVIDIDGFKKYPNGKYSKDEYWYDDELHRKSCELLFNVLKEIGIDFIVCCSGSGGYHFYYRSRENIITSDVEVLKYLKYPEEWEIEELRGKPINGELGEGVEILTKRNSKMVVTYPSKINETKTNPITDEKEIRRGQYELLEKVNYIRELKPVDDLSGKIKDVFIKQGFIFDEESYNNGHKQKEKLKKSINNTPSIDIKDPEITEELINHIMPFYKEGSRNDFSFRLIGFLRKQGWSKEIIKELFEQMHCDDGYTEHESRVESVFKKNLDEVAGWNNLSEYISDSSATEEEKTKALEYFTSLRGNQLKILPKKLIDEGWELIDGCILYIPYNNIPDTWDKKKIEGNYYLKYQKIADKKYEYSWCVRTPKGEEKRIGKIYQNNKSFDIEDSNRNRALGRYVKFGLPREGNEKIKNNRWVGDYLDEIDIEYSTNNIGEKIEENFIILPNLIVNEGQEENEHPLNFEDYPESIRKQALKIIERGNIIDEMLDACNITHEGDRKQLNLLFLSYESLFINESVHQKLGGRSGVGKTDVVETSIATIPDKYVFKFRNPSPKYIHYSCENFNEDYNLIVNDDATLSLEMIELNKSITDPNDKEKTHNTVINGKAVTFKLPGEYLGIYNLVKTIEDEEFLNRLFLSDVSEDGADKSYLKEKIKQNINTEIKDSELLESLRFMLKAVWQWHIDKKIRVFNPYSIFLDVKDKNNRNVSSIIKLIKANSFFKYSEREKVNGIVIGSLNDLKEVLELWEDKSLVQDYKLDPKQVEILKILECYEEEEIEKIKSDFIDNPTEIKQKVNTLSNISTELGIPYTTIRRLIRDSDGTQVGLKGMGLVQMFNLDENNIKAGTVVYINPEHKNNVKGLKNGLDINHLNQTLKGYTFNTLNSKKKLVYGFLLVNQIIINKEEEKKINSFLENLNYEVNTYEDVVTLLNNVKELLSNEFSENKDFSEYSYDEIKESFSITQNNTNPG